MNKSIMHAVKISERTYLPKAAIVSELESFFHREISVQPFDLIHIRYDILFDRKKEKEVA